MRSQGYDGASNMSSGRVGVQARIREKAPLATYVHCNGHCLNLVISTTFEFIVVFMTMYLYLSHLSGIAVKLQRRALDIVEANEMISKVTTMYKDERKNVDSGFDQIYAQSVTMAEKVGAVVSMPCIASRQQHQSNAEASSPSE